MEILKRRVIVENRSNMYYQEQQFSHVKNEKIVKWLNLKVDIVSWQKILSDNINVTMLSKSAYLGIHLSKVVNGISLQLFASPHSFQMVSTKSKSL